MDAKSRLVYLAGITPRSGTNWLYSLILKHPECRRALGWEDYFVRHAEHLSAYTQGLRRSWKEDWPLHQRGADSAVLRQFGQGLRRVLACSNDEEGLCDVTSPEREISGGRLLTKTPSVEGIEQFFTLFPESHLIILIRDGRSVVESGMRTFDWSFEQAVHRWRNAARTILEFDEREEDGLYYIIRYEDLFRDTIGELKDLLEFLRLDFSAYDFEAAIDTPVRGSSTYGQDDGDVDWAPVEKREDFSPLRRWDSWSDARLDRFHWIAGEELRALGYSTERGSRPWRRKMRRGYWELTDRVARGIRKVRRGVGRRIVP
ncbi:MAG: sulfotransferase [Salinibacter sp.]